MKRIWILWIATLFLFVGLLYIFIKSERESLSKRTLSMVNSYLHYSRTPFEKKSGEYMIPMRFLATYKVGTGRYIYSYNGMLCDTVKIAMTHPSENYFYGYHRVYDQAFYSGLIDIERWLESYKSVLVSAGIDIEPLAIQIVDSLDNVLLSTDFSEILKYKNRIVSTSGVRWGNEYNHRVVAYFWKPPFYQGIETPLIVSLIFLLFFFYTGIQLLRYTLAEVRMISHKMQGVAHIKHELDKPLSMALQGIVRMEREINHPSIGIIKTYLSKMINSSLSILGDLGKKSE